MPDSLDNPSAQQPFSPTPVPPAPAAAPPPTSGSSVLKIVLIIVGIFVAIGIVGAGIIGYGIYRVAHAVHTAANGQVTIGSAGSGFSASTAQPVSESDLGIAIYPGATQGKGSLHMTIAGKSMVSANYLTSDSKDQVVAFYKDKVGPAAQSMMTDTGGEFILSKGSDSITVTVRQSPNMNDGKTQITIIHTGGAS